MRSEKLFGWKEGALRRHGIALADSRNGFVNVTGVYFFFFVCAYNLTFYGADNTNGNVKCVV